MYAKGKLKVDRCNEASLMTLPTQLRHPTLDIIRTSVTGRITEYATDSMHWNASLWDFDINGPQLKPYHYGWLASLVNNVNTSHRSFIWHIWISGGASLTGMNIRPNNGWNYDLARARVAEVYKYLKDNLKVVGLVYHGPDTSGIQLAEYRGHRLGVERDEDRAVYVQVTSESTPPRPPVPTKIPQSKNWAIRFVKGSAVGAFVVGLEIGNFEIADTDNRLYAMYKYTGDSIGAAVSFADISVSYTFKGDWKDFKTSEAINIADFDGPCRFTTAGMPFTSISQNYLTVTPSAGVTTDPEHLEIDTGRTLGGGASITIPGSGWLWFRFGPVHYDSGAYPR